MNKLHSLAFYALVTPAITLGAGSVLAQQSTGQDMDRDQRSSQREHADQKTHRTGQSDSQKMADRKSMENRGYISAVPNNGMQATQLIGATVSTTTDEDVGPVNDLIIDEQGQVVAIVVAVGGFLGLGEKDVAIGWKHVTPSGTFDEQKLRIDLSRENLRSAPEFDLED